MFTKHVLIMIVWRLDWFDGIELDRSFWSLDRQQCLRIINVNINMLSRITTIIGTRIVVTAAIPFGQQLKYIENDKQ